MTCETTGEEVTWIILNGSSILNTVTLRPGIMYDNLVPYVTAASHSFNMQTNQASSTLSMILDSSLNGIVIECEDVTSAVVGSVTIEIAGIIIHSYWSNSL